jgi:4-hydroxybenzoate polyprenyltransferase
VIGDLARLVRAPAALSVPGDAVAGAAAAGCLGPRTVALAGGAVCLYWAGMALNDWADRDLDAVERPERPIPSGRVSAPTALVVAASLTGAGVALAATAGGRRSLAVAVPLAVAVWGYDLRWKHTRWGPVAMAACRGLDVLLGASPGRLARAVPDALLVAAHTVTVTALSRHETTGTTAALPRATLAATGAIAALAAARPSTCGVSRVQRPRRPAKLHNSTGWGTGRAAGWGTGRAAGWALATGYAAAYGRAQARAAADPCAGTVRSAVGSGITALPMLQASLTARHGATPAALAVAALGPFARRLARWVSPT